MRLLNTIREKGKERRIKKLIETFEEFREFEQEVKNKEIEGMYSTDLSFAFIPLIEHSKTLSNLTTALLILTLVLAVLTAWDIWLLVK